MQLCYYHIMVTMVCDMEGFINRKCKHKMRPAKEIFEQESLILWEQLFKLWSTLFYFHKSIIFQLFKQVIWSITYAALRCTEIRSWRLRRFYFQIIFKTSRSIISAITIVHVLYISNVSFFRNFIITKSEVQLLPTLDFQLLMLMEIIHIDESTNTPQLV